MYNLFYTALIALGLLQIKHVLADFLFQTKYMWSNKTPYGHPGGVLHVLVHGVLSLPALLYIGLPLPLVALLIVAEMVLHYHIDWAKDRLGTAMKLAPNSNGFWILFGSDQGLHQLTYLAMAGWAVTRVA